jgi:TRAP-type C4-dicarboxylate transport system permease small subunit
MHGPSEDHLILATTATSHPLVAVADRALAVCNRIIVVLSAIAMIAACCILSYSVAVRALFHSPTYWQDEASVFLLVGVTFMTSAFVQADFGRCRHVCLLHFLRVEIMDAGSRGVC